MNRFGGSIASAVIFTLGQPFGLIENVAPWHKDAQLNSSPSKNSHDVDVGAPWGRVSQAPV